MEKIKKNDPVYRHLRLALIRSLRYIQEFVEKEHIPTLKVKYAKIQKDGSFTIVSKQVNDYKNLIYDHRSHLLKLPEVVDLIEFLTRNKSINELLFQPLRSTSVRHEEIGYAEEYKRNKIRDAIYFQFLINYCGFEVFPFFKEKCFHDLFVRLMYYLHSSKKMYYLSPLTSFEMETALLELEDGVVIRRIRSEEFLAMNAQHTDSILSGREKYLIELCSDMTSDHFQPYFAEDQTNFVLETLRLFKKGSVDNMLIVQGIENEKWILGTQGSVTFNTHRIAKPSAYELNKHEIVRFKQFYKHCKIVLRPNRRFLRNAVKRFSSAIKENNLDDKIIDLFITLESLFSDGSGEMTYKLRARTSFLMGTTPSKADHIYEFMGKAYDTRSKIVHGGEGKWKFVITKEEVVNQLEDYSRFAVKIILRMIRNKGSSLGKDGLIRHIDTQMVKGRKPKAMLTR